MFLRSGGTIGSAKARSARRNGAVSAELFQEKRKNSLLLKQGHGDSVALFLENLIPYPRF